MEIPDVSVLEDRMPEWFRSTRTFAGLSVMLLVVFLFLNYRPLWHTDLWGHLAYGRLIRESGLGVLYGNEPLMPLAEGIRFTDTAWLSQVIGFLAYESLGISALQFLFAFSVTLCLGLLTWRFYRRTESALVTVLGLVMFVVVAWQQMFVNAPSVFVPSALIRPQLAGWVCFIALFVALTSRRWHKSYWALIPLLFAVWANLHGSFLVGLTLLGCLLLGRAIDIERRTKKLGAILKDPMTQRYFFLLELSAVAVLLNPYGLGIYSAVLEVSNHPNMQNLVEWDPLTLRTNQGSWTGFAALVLVFVYRWSPRRVQSAEVLLLAGFGGLTLYYSRFLIWWAPLAAYYLVLHGNPILKEDRAKQPVPKPEKKTSLNTVVCFGLLWIVFAITPFGSRVIHQREPDFSKSVGPLTPVRAAEYLKQRAAENTLPPGLIFNSYQWGDYLLWTAPGQRQVFVSSHVQFLPETVWAHYFDVVNLNLGYDRILAGYGVNVVLLSKSMHRRTIDRLREDGPWRTDYEDDRAVILVRGNPI